MAQKQTRKSISTRGELYWRLKEHCDATKQTMSGVVTSLIEDYLDGVKPAPLFTEDEFREARLRKIKEIQGRR